MATPQSHLGLARRLRNDVYAIAGENPTQRVLVHELELRHPRFRSVNLGAAIALAIEKGWMTGEGDPARSVCLTDNGRRLSWGARW